MRSFWTECTSLARARALRMPHLHKEEFQGPPDMNFYFVCLLFFIVFIQIPNDISQPSFPSTIPPFHPPSPSPFCLCESVSLPAHLLPLQGSNIPLRWGIKLPQDQGKLLHSLCFIVSYYLMDYCIIWKSICKPLCFIRHKMTRF